MIMNYVVALVVSFFAVTASAVTVTAHSWVVADQAGAILQESNSHELRSIASITKLMTAMVVLDAQQDLDKKIGLHTRRQLLQLALIKSDNNAAATLCRNYPGGRDSCLLAMNAKARTLNMRHTKFVDSTGLGVMNISTGRDLVAMVLAAKNYKEIVESSQSAVLRIGKTMIYNTNRLVNQTYTISKTGYIRAAGGCIVMMLDTVVGQRIVILLGSKNTHTRVPEAEFISRSF